MAVLYISLIHVNSVNSEMWIVFEILSVNCEANSQYRTDSTYVPSSN